MIIVIYNENTKEFEVLPNRLNGNKYIWQYDYGQTLRIQGLNLPSAVEIHFSLQETGGTSVNRVGVTKDGVTDVIIPDSMLENDGADRTYDIFAFIYLTDDTSGQTEYKIKLQVKSRPKPEVPGGGENPNIFHEAVQAVRKSADKAAESEKQAEGWAHGREDLPERAQDNAKYYAGQTAADAKKTGTDRKEVERLVESVAGIDEQVVKVENLTKQAQTSATNAALSEQAAKTAETNAQTAQAGAETAEGNAELAEQGAKASEQAVERAKQLVTQMGQEVLDNKNHVDQTVQAFTLTAQQAVADVNNAGQAQTERVQSAGNTAAESVKTAQGAATQAVETAKTEAVKAVQTEGTTQTGNVTREGEKQVQAVQAAAQEIVADREQIQENKTGIEALKQGKADAIVETASGETIQAEDSSGLGVEGLRIFGKSTQDGVPSPESPVPIVNIGDKGNVKVEITGNNAEPQSITLTTPNGLLGIKVKTDGNYTDSTGQQWVCNEIDLERGKYVQRVGKYIFDGTEITQDTWLPTIVVSMRPDGLTGVVYSTRFLLSNYGATDFSNNTGRSFGFDSEKWKVSNGKELTAFFKSKYDTGKPVEAQYVLASPVEHDLIPEEIAAYKVLHTNYPTTVVSNDESAHMEVSYVADTKNYIASKIETPLQKQITDLQNALISQKISGGGIKVTDSARVPVVNFAMWGKTEQVKTTGTNLFDVSKIDDAWNGSYGIKNNNGVLTVVSNSSSSAVDTNKTLKELCPQLKNNETYVFNAVNSGKSNMIYLNNAKKIWFYHQPMAMTEEALNSRVYLYISDKINDSGTIRNIQVNRGESILPYEPYSGGFPSPSPDWEQPIEVTDQPVTVTVKGGTEQQSITLVPPRPLTKWDKLEKVDGVWRWMYQSRWIESYVDENITGEYISTTGGLNAGAKVCYKSTPEYIPLPQPVQDKLNVLTMYAGTTEITNDGGCNMELTYTVDTQSYVDTKIAEVSKAII